MPTRTLLLTLAALTGLTLAAPVASAKKVNPDRAAAEFDVDALRFYKWVACGDAEVTAHAQDVALDGARAKVVAEHCKWMKARYAEYTKKFVTKASAFFAEVRPAGLPAKVVYPFGGGDVVSAMVVYPDADEVTTISLEHAGDPTRLGQLTAKELKTHLATFRKVVRGLLTYTDSASATLRKLEKGPIPGQLSFFVTGMAVLGYVPQRLRYFRLEADGTIHYFTVAEVSQLETKKATRKSRGWVDTDWSEVYTSSELEFAKVGDPADIVIHRHLAANLDDEHFLGSSLEKHLDAKGARVSAMTKASSYLLWQDAFAGIRTWIGTHLAWMVSDSTGIPPRHAAAMGLEQTAYGKFGVAKYYANKKDTEAFAALWKSKKRKLPFRFGYLDTDGNAGLLITAPAATGARK